MNLYAFFSLFTAVSSLALGIFVYLRGRGKTHNRILALYTLSVAVWTFGQFVLEFLPGANALFWARFNTAGAIFIPVFYLHFVLAYLGEAAQRKSLIRLLYGTGIFFTIFNFTPLLVAKVVPKLSFKYYPEPGPLYVPYAIILLASVSYGIYKLIKGLKGSTGIRRNQIAYILAASLVGFLGGFTSTLLVFNVPIYPVGYYFVPLYTLIAVYAIARHRLLDIAIVIRKGLVYSILIGLFTGAYLLVILLFGYLFQSVTGANSILAMVLFILAFTVGFQPLKDRLEDAVDRILFKEKYDYQKTLKGLSQAAVSIVKLDELLELILKRVTEVMRINCASIVLLNNKTHNYILKGALGLPSDFKTKLNDENCLIHHLKTERKALVLDETMREGNLRVAEELRCLRAALCIPMFAKDNLVGLFNLGEKISGDMFNTEDIDLLSILVNQVAVAIENSMLYEDIFETQKQLYRADKLAALGTIAAGMAHEIKNPLAALKGLTQVLPQNLENQEFLNTFNEIIPRQLDRINNLVEDLLRFGRPSTLLIRGIDLNAILEENLKLMSNQCQKGRIQIVKELGEIPQIKGDKEQLTQALINLMLNAIQAMPEGGILSLRSFMNSDQRIGIEISDTGVGIEEEKLKNIFDPFFTTKDKGVGLGLSIAYRIIQDHSGTIEVESRPGQGTAFRIYL